LGIDCRLAGLGLVEFKNPTQECWLNNI
jgi:hypothetical protein